MAREQRRACRGLETAALTMSHEDGVHAQLAEVASIAVKGERVPLLRIANLLPPDRREVKDQPRPMDKAKKSLQRVAHRFVANNQRINGSDYEPSVGRTVMHTLVASRACVSSRQRMDSVVYYFFGLVHYIFSIL